jgi:class 3 adenylate cyclase
MTLKVDSQLFKTLLDSARAVSMGDYEQTDNLMELTNLDKYPAEIANLAEAFGMMIVNVETREYNLEQLLEELKQKNEKLLETLQRVQMLESIQSHMRKFVPQSVQDLITDNPDNPDLVKRDKEISVLFLDIAGYTKMSENISQDKMNYLIETYFSQFLDIIIQNGGDINETAGDGLMILFHNSPPRPNATNAVAAAIEIREKTEAINKSLKNRFDPVTVNMGINSGLASVGSTRFKGIAGDRWTYTASGSVTNIAARICSIATEGKILITRDTSDIVKKKYSLSPPEEHRLKNVSKPIPIHEVLVT